MDARWKKVPGANVTPYVMTTKGSWMTTAILHMSDLEHKGVHEGSEYSFIWTNVSQT